MPSKSDTVPAMLTPGEVVLNEKQQKALEKYVGQSREEIFGKIKVPGFNIGGKVKKYYAEGGQAKDKELSQREKNIKGWQRGLDIAIQRERAGTPQPDNLNWYYKQYLKKPILYRSEAKKVKAEKSYTKAKEKASKMRAAGYKLPPGLKDGGKVKKKKKYNKGGMVKKAYSRMYKAKWGG